jgi:hypothetical protein
VADLEQMAAELSGTVASVDTLVEKTIADLREKVRRLQQENIRYGSELRRLKRGEFICRTCGLRKDAEKQNVDF